MNDRVLYLRPGVDSEDLGLRYRDRCNLTGQCPGCSVDVEHTLDGDGGLLIYKHDDDCPVLTSAARPDWSAPMHAEVRPSRNARCPCGSGRKYKHCHGRAA